MVEISAMTLNALKQLLFTEDGVNLTNIVKDLAAGGKNEDLSAINVGLTFKGIKPEMDMSPRWGNFNEYWRQYSAYTPTGYSLILDRVTYKKCEISRDKEKDKWTSGEVREDSMPMADWLGLTTEKADVDAFVAKILEKYPVVEEQPSNEE
jgi:alkylated DNA repair dioxygenase AlkB